MSNLPAGELVSEYWDYRNHDAWQEKCFLFLLVLLQGLVREVWFALQRTCIIPSTYTRWLSEPSITPARIDGERGEMSLASKITCTETHHVMKSLKKREKEKRCSPMVEVG